MEKITYRQYLANPEIREQMEREARRARAEAVHSLVVAPLVRMAKQLFLRAEHKAARPMHVPA